MNIGIHISHEAAKKIGGIGSVLSGICNTETYQNRFQRTIFYGPLFDDQSSEKPDRLGKDSEVLFSSLDTIEEDYPKLKLICEQFHIDIVYGKKKVYDEIHPGHSTEVEIVLAGIKRLRFEEVNKLKYRVWERFGFQSELYDDWDFEQYLRIAIPFIPLLNALCEKNDDLTAYSHEYMGVACCLELIMNDTLSAKTYFYAHEVSTARALVEKIPGHDVTFYHFLKKDPEVGISMEDRFGSQKGNNRSELIKLAINFDGIIAVGDWVKQEYQYLQPKAKSEQIEIIYNGVPTNSVSFEEKLQARQRLIDYCRALFNFQPDIILSHVTRLVISKGLWRDIKLLEELDEHFYQNKLTGFYILLSSLISGGRRPDEIQRMEKEYGWPVLHREGYPDLIDYEKDVYHSLAIFNAKSKAIKGVFINQYGFAQETTGERIPEGSSFSDLRHGSDAELGFSIYEPFGIAQIETVPYGGLALLSRQCGCSFLLDRIFSESAVKPYYCIDFSETELKDDDEALSISYDQRSEIESKLLSKHAGEIFSLLPKSNDDRKELFMEIRKYAHHLSWENNLGNFPD